MHTGNAKNRGSLKSEAGSTRMESTRSGPVRGYAKLADAAKYFHFDFCSKVVLDIGSSTGGFTEYALKHGAEKVIAVEKGTNQMELPLRYNPRIELHEKTDIFAFPLNDKIDTIVADVSFLSLTKVLYYLKNELPNQSADFLMMLKPQFEARSDQLHNGIVKNDRIRREIIKDFEHWLSHNGFIIINKHDNSLRGKTGNQERFYWLRRTNAN